MNRILIVDDEKSIREAVKEYAEFSGFEVIQAQDGVEAVEKVRHRITSYNVCYTKLLRPKDSDRRNL